VNELDLILIFIILLCVFIGWRRGVVRVLFSIAGIYATVIVVGYLYATVGDILSRAANRIGIGLGVTQAEILTYVVVLIAMTVVVELLSRNTFEETRIRSIGVLDKILGATVGILYGMLWASLFLVLIQYSVAQTGDTWTTALYGSSLVPTLNRFFQTAVLDVVSIFFTGGVPELFLNRVSQRLVYLFNSLALLPI
jgi:uncharacterized membrane protein required for colicin V production